MDPSTSEAALKLEIARLSGAINRHKSTTTAKPNQAYKPRSNVYVNPNLKRPNQYVRPVSTASVPAASSTTTTFSPAFPSISQASYSVPKPQSGPANLSAAPHEVVLNGVAFNSSGRSLVRKDCAFASPANLSQRHDICPSVTLQYVVPKPPSSTKTIPSKQEYVRSKAGHLLPANRSYKAIPTRGRRGRGRGGPVNMTLNNTHRPYQSVWSSIWRQGEIITIFHLSFPLLSRSRRAAKRMKYQDKPCPRFTTTGSCPRGLTCPYQHDPSKIAICWPFLQGTCPNSADSCPLSHDPIPERTPLCVHFANAGRCTRAQCPFPHVRTGVRDGVCRDFAVLGYCEKGLDCERQHVRECPDFAERGTCSTKGCKLPHVIRANRNRQKTGTNAAGSGGSVATVSVAAAAIPPSSSKSADTDSFKALQASAQEPLIVTTTAEDAQLGDEFISLTFREESSDDEDEDGEDEEDEDEDGEDDNAQDEEEAASPTEDDDNMEASIE